MPRDEKTKDRFAASLIHGEREQFHCDPDLQQKLCPLQGRYAEQGRLDASGGFTFFLRGTADTPRIYEEVDGNCVPSQS